MITPSRSQNRKLPYLFETFTGKKIARKSFVVIIQEAFAFDIESFLARSLARDFVLFCGFALLLVAWFN
jgi:hypothetical protein